MSDALETIILKPMMALWMPPKQGEEVEALKQYTDALRGFAEADLKAGWQVVRDNHQGRGWPAVGALVKACAIAKGQRVGAGLPRNRSQADRERRWQHWLEVSRSDLAHTAAEEGWCWSLKAKILYDGARASQISITEMRAAHNDAADLADALERDAPVMRDGKERLFSASDRDMALTLWRGVLVHEADTQSEIARAARTYAESDRNAQALLPV